MFKKSLSILIFASGVLFATVVAAEKQATFDEFDLVLEVNDIQVGGTLLKPKKSATNHLVIMLSGSGPQDRDETLDDFKVLGVVAEHLAKNGIPSFRFDDRGEGKSTGDFVNSTLNDHRKDVEGIMAFFKDHDKYGYDRFILLGHSQGAIVGANVAINNKEVVKLVLMGPPSVPLVDIVLYQVRQEYKGRSLDRAIIEEDVSAHNNLMWSLDQGQKLEDALDKFYHSAERILKLGANHQESDIEQIKAMAKRKTEEFEIVYALPSLTSFLYHDTARDYERLEVPVLALFGGKDLQVTIEQNKDVLERALLKSGIKYKFKTFHDANHYFQKAETGERSEYGTLEKRFVGGFLETISTWIVQ